MLAKNKLSMFLLALLWMGSLIGSYAILYDYTLRPAEPTGPDLFSITGLLIWAATTLIFSLVAWNIPFLSELDEKEGFGLTGFIRWLFCGLISGSLCGLYQAGLARWLDEHNFFRPALEVLVPPAIFALVYWLIFRRNPWSVKSSKPEPPGNVQLTRFFGFFLVLFGAILIIFSLYAMYTLSKGNPVSIIRGVGIWLWGAAVIFLAIEEMALTEPILPARIRRGMPGLAGAICGAAGCWLIFVIGK